MAGTVEVREIIVARVFRPGDFRQRKQNVYGMRELPGGVRGAAENPASEEAGYSSI